MSMNQQISAESINRQPRLGTRLAISFALLATVAAGIVAATLYISFRNELRQDLRQRVTNITQLASLQQDGDKFRQITSSADPIYEEFRVQNLKIRRADPDIEFVFTATRRADGLFYFVVDAGEPGEENIAAYGEWYEEPSETFLANYDSMMTAVADPDIYTDAYGSFLSAYAPIFTKDGERVGVIGVDFTADTVVAKERDYLLLTLGVFAALLPFIIIFGWFIGNRIAKPIIGLTSAADKITGGDLDYRAESVQSNTREVSLLAVSFDVMADRLQELIGGLEERVSERTAALQAASEQVGKRANQLQLVTDIAKTIAAAHELDKTLPLIASSISDTFGFYHTGIFLLDEERQFAILRATNSAGGQNMLKRGHKLKVGAEGIVGYVSLSGRVRIALDADADSTFRENPDLPETRSEIALPLIANDEIIGVLDVQSTDSEAFKAEDVQVLNTLASQVANTILNARLYSQTRTALAEAEKITQQYVQQQWQSYTSQASNVGYVYNGEEAYPVLRGQAAPEHNNQEITVPVVLRGQVIGNLSVKPKNPAEKLSEDKLLIVNAAAERAALALENARLLENSRRRVITEQTIGEISSLLSASSDIDVILQTAVSELSKVVADSNIAIQFVSGTGYAPSFEEEENV